MDGLICHPIGIRFAKGSFAITQSDNVLDELKGLNICIFNVLITHLILNATKRNARAGFPW